MRKPAVKNKDLPKLKKVAKLLFNDGKVRGKYGRHAKAYLAEVLLVD